MSDKNIGFKKIIPYYILGTLLIFLVITICLQSEKTIYTDTPYIVYFDTDSTTYYTIDEGCVSEIICYIPYNYTGKLDIDIEIEDICYDIKGDPLDYYYGIERLKMEYMGDWWNYLDTLPEYEKDPIISVIETDIDEVYCEKIWGYKKDEN